MKQFAQNLLPLIVCIATVLAVGMPVTPKRSEQPVLQPIPSEKPQCVPGSDGWEPGYILSGGVFDTSSQRVMRLRQQSKTSRGKAKKVQKRKLATERRVIKRLARHCETLPPLLFPPVQDSPPAVITRVPKPTAVTAWTFEELLTKIPDGSPSFALNFGTEMHIYGLRDSCSQVRVACVPESDIGRVCGEEHAAGCMSASNCTIALSTATCALLGIQNNQTLLVPSESQPLYGPPWPQSTNPADIERLCTAAHELSHAQDDMRNVTSCESEDKAYGVSHLCYLEAQASVCQIPSSNDCRALRLGACNEAAGQAFQSCRVAHGRNCSCQGCLDVCKQAYADCTQGSGLGIRNADEVCGQQAEVYCSPDEIPTPTPRPTSTPRPVSCEETLNHYGESVRLFFDPNSDDLQNSVVLNKNSPTSYRYFLPGLMNIELNCYWPQFGGNTANWGFMYSSIGGYGANVLFSANNLTAGFDFPNFEASCSGSGCSGTHRFKIVLDVPAF